MNQKNRTQEKVKLQVLADKPVFACDAASERILEIRVSSPERDESKECAPLNLSFVLDRSGSMRGISCSL